MNNNRVINVMDYTDEEIEAIEQKINEGIMAGAKFDQAIDNPLPPEELSKRIEEHKKYWEEVDRLKAEADKKNK